MKYRLKKDTITYFGFATDVDSVDKECFDYEHDQI